MEKVPVASLDETIFFKENNPSYPFLGRIDSGIFGGSYASKWDEVHLRSPILWKKINVLAEFGNHAQQPSDSPTGKYSNDLSSESEETEDKQRERRYRLHRLKLE